jgi:hypothetical protein
MRRPGESPSERDAGAAQALPDASVIIVNWNTADVLQCCMHTVRRARTAVDGEWVVVDNASAAADLAPLRRKCRTCTLIENPVNKGFAAAANQAVRLNRGRYVLLLNPDTVLDHGCLEHLVAYLDDHPDVAIVGPAIFDLDGRLQGSARAFPGPLTALFGRRSFLTRRFPGNPISRRNIPALTCDLSSPIPVDWVSGTCLLARRDALEAVGFLDERFFLYWEDADVAWRLRNAGWRVTYDPRARAVHLVGASSRQAPLQTILHFHRSAFRLYRLHVTKHVLHRMNAVAAAALLVRAFLLALGHVWFRHRDADGAMASGSPRPARPE